jgi:hypothetical protein
MMQSIGVAQPDEEIHVLRIVLQVFAMFRSTRSFLSTLPSTDFTSQLLVAPDNQHRFETCALGHR